MPHVNVDCAKAPTRIQVLRRSDIGYPVDSEWKLFKAKMASRIQYAWRRWLEHRDETRLRRMTQAAIVMQRMFRWRRRVFKLRQVETQSFEAGIVSCLDEVMAKRSKVLTELTAQARTAHDVGVGKKGWNEYVTRLHKEVARHVDELS